MKINIIHSNYICTILLFIIFTDRAYSDYVCNGTVILTDDFGIITDHTGIGNYPESLTCNWLISPSSNSYLTIFFSKFELEAQWDYLYIFDGNSSSNTLLYAFTGYAIPARISTPGPTVLLQFYSDKLITFSGFQLNYTAASCNDRCSNHGYCLNDVCYCDDGYTGEQCEKIIGCANNSCYDTPVTCPANTWGPSCTSRFCYGITHILASSAIISDHSGFGDYQPYSHCEWYITPNNSAHSVKLRFTFFDTELSNDTVTIYDGFNTSSKLIGQFSGGFPVLQPIISSTGVMRVVFVSGGYTERGGFRAEITSGFCPNNCGNHGHCFFNTCVCDVGYHGNACEQVLCENDCSGHGICAESQCLCFSDSWLGTDCSICNELECIQGSTASCPPGGITFNQYNSTFYDYVGLKSSDTCLWKLAPPSGDSLLIRFTKFSLPYYSLLSVYDNNKLLSQYSDSSPSISPIISSSSNVLVTMSTSTSNPLLGSAMVAQYITYFCPNKCSGQGTCIAGVCYCYSGFTGDNCSQAYCPNSCSGNGNCVNNTCVCNPGFYGSDCSSLFCMGTVILSSRNGTISDHIGATYYLPNTSCSFLIRPSVPTSSISLTFSRFQLETFDIIKVYDGANNSSPLLFSDTGSWLPYPVRSTGGSLLIEFTTSNTNQNTGFTFSWWSNELCGCVDNSSICLDGQCICSSMKNGGNCSQDAQVVSLKNGVAVISEISEWSWKIFSFEVNNTVGQLSWQFQRFYNMGYPEFFLSYGDIPTLTDYNQYHFYFLSSDHRIVVHNPQYGVWYLGVLNHKTEGTTNITVSVSARVGCIDDCGTLGYCVDNLYCFCNDTVNMNNCSGNGICTSGGCACFDGYFGTSCQYSSCSPPCKNGGLCSGYNLCNCVGTGFVGPTCADLPGSNVTCNCLNGGTCDTSGVCSCLSGYAGSYCENWKCDIPCSNGGTCVGPNKCQCTENYQGPFCLVESSTLNSDKKDSDDSTKQVLIGLIVALCASIVGLGTMVTIAVVLRRSRARIPVAGAAGMDELHSM